MTYVGYEYATFHDALEDTLQTRLMILLSLPPWMGVGLDPSNVFVAILKALT